MNTIFALYTIYSFFGGIIFLVLAPRQPNPIKILIFSFFCGGFSFIVGIGFCLVEFGVADKISKLGESFTNWLAK